METRYKHLVVFVQSNPVSPDPRVEKEVRMLTTHGFEVIILAWDREKASKNFESSGNKTIYRFGLRAPYVQLIIVAYYPFFWLWVLLKLLRIRPQIVHACDIDCIFPALFYKLLKGKTKVIFDVFDSYALLIRPMSNTLASMVWCLELFAASVSDAFITVSRQQLALFEAAQPKRVEIVMNSPSPISRSTFLNQGTKHTKFRIVHAGQILEDRGLLQLCEATKDIDDLELVIAGRVRERAEREAMRRIKKFSHVHYVGRLDYDGSLQLEASADLIPLLYHPKVAISHVAMPNKLFEAMMLGVPIITNLDHVVRDVECGIVVNYYDINDIRKVILHLKDHPQFRSQLGLNGKRTFDLKFSWSHMERRLLKLYDQLMSVA